MQNPMQNFRQSSIVSEKQGILSKNWKFWRPPTTIEFNIFCWNFAHVSWLPMSTKACSGFFLFCLDLEFFAKIKKPLVSTQSQKPVF